MSLVARIRTKAHGAPRTNRLARLRYWPAAVYTEHLTAEWRRVRPAPRVPTLPLAATDPSAPPRLRCALVCHVFYLDLLDEIAGAVANLTDGTDVYVSVVTDRARAIVAERLRTIATGTVDVRVVPNRGRDIAPKYVTFADVYRREYDLVLFLHTKKTTVASIGTGWREHLYSSLAGSREQVLSVLRAFEDRPGLGILAPAHHSSIEARTGWHGSYAHAARLARWGGFETRRWEPPPFASGSMFWARPAALAPISRMGLRIEDFPHEAAQNAYTVMHALERLTFVSAASAGLSAAFIEDDETEPPGPGPHPVVPAARPTTRMRLAALRPTVAEILRETLKRRTKLHPRRIRTWMTRPVDRSAT